MQMQRFAAVCETILQGAGKGPFGLSAFVVHLEHFLSRLCVILISLTHVLYTYICVYARARKILWKFARFLYFWIFYLIPFLRLLQCLLVQLMYIRATSTTHYENYIAHPARKRVKIVYLCEPDAIHRQGVVGTPSLSWISSLYSFPALAHGCLSSFDLSLLLDGSVSLLIPVSSFALA